MLVRRANNGDVIAAKRVWYYYAWYEMDEKNAFIWMKKSAELGDEDAIKMISREKKN